MDESFNLSDDSSGPSPGIVRKKKIAIGVIFSLSRDEDENNKFNEFFFSHFPLFESHMNKLKSAIEQVNTVLLILAIVLLCVPPRPVRLNSSLLLFYKSGINLLLGIGLAPEKSFALQHL